MRIFITSYPYVYERYFRVFDYFPKKEELFFILPKTWEAKGGKIRAKVPTRDNIKVLGTKAFFSHSHYPVVRGLLKGWMPRAKSILRREARPGDVLYTAIEPNLLTTMMNAIWAKKHGIKHVFFTWQNIPYRQRLSGIKLWLTEKIIKTTVKNSSGAICGNTKAAEIIRNYADSNFKTLIAPISGVDIERFKPGLSSDFRQKHNLNGKIVLTFAGVFDQRKGISTLLKAFLATHKENPTLHLVMVGTGPLQDYIEQFKHANRLAGFMTVVNWLSNEELPGVLCTSDIFVHPSEPYGGWEEQFGYSMAEASASGLPVISTDTGSINEVVLNGETGILIASKQPEQLSRAILNLATNSSLRKQMGESGRRHIENNYSHEVIAKRFYDFLNSFN